MDEHQSSDPEMAPQMGDGPAMAPQMGDAPEMAPQMGDAEMAPQMGDAPHMKEHESIGERIEHLIHHKPKPEGM